MVAEELAGYYAILLSGIDNNTQVKMTVEGIKNTKDYAGLLRYVEGLAAVNGVQISQVEGGSVELQLRTGGQLRQLIESIALDRKMIPVAEVTRVNQDVFMHYLWQVQ
jgi:hypothetical protein